MSAKQRLNGRLEAAATLRAAGQFDKAREILQALAVDPEVDALGQRTSLGLPRRLQSALLKVAKAEKDRLISIGYQYHLVPPPSVLQRFATFTTTERRQITAANRETVPRHIHQIWIGSNPEPVGTSAWEKHAQLHGYSYRLWREDTLRHLGIEDNRVYQDRLANGDLPGAVDVARYLILQRYGGIYLDCDWYPARDDISFHDLLTLTGLCAMAEEVPRNTGKGGLLLANSMLAAPPHHPVFKRLVESLDDVMSELPNAPAWWATGPLLFTMICRGGSVTLADADFVAGALPQDTSPDDVQSFCDKAQATDSGLLLAWKSWVWE